MGARDLLLHLNLEDWRLVHSAAERLHEPPEWLLRDALYHDETQTKRLTSAERTLEVECTTLRTRIMQTDSQCGGLKLRNLESYEHDRQLAQRLLLEAPHVRALGLLSADDEAQLDAWARRYVLRQPPREASPRTD